MEKSRTFTDTLYASRKLVGAGLTLRSVLCSPFVPWFGHLCSRTPAERRATIPPENCGQDTDNITHGVERLYSRVSGPTVREPTG